MKHYLVTGRMCGDDEDTAKSFQAESRHDAVDIYVELMWEGTDAETRDLFERTGEGVFINGIFVSDTPIEEAT